MKQLLKFLARCFRRFTSPLEPSFSQRLTPPTELPFSERPPTDDEAIAIVARRALETGGMVIAERDENGFLRFK